MLKIKNPQFSEEKTADMQTSIFQPKMGEICWNDAKK